MVIMEMTGRMAAGRCLGHRGMVHPGWSTAEGPRGGAVTGTTRAARGCGGEDAPCDSGQARNGTKTCAMPLGGGGGGEVSWGTSRGTAT
jgi:hypothetical protein